MSPEAQKILDLLRSSPANVLRIKDVHRDGQPIIVLAIESGANEQGLYVNPVGTQPDDLLAELLNANAIEIHSTRYRHYILVPMEDKSVIKHPIVDPSGTYIGGYKAEDDPSPSRPLEKVQEPVYDYVARQEVPPQEPPVPKFDPYANDPVKTLDKASVRRGRPPKKAK